MMESHLDWNGFGHLWSKGWGQYRYDIGLVKRGSSYILVSQMFCCFTVSGCEEPEPLLNGGVTLLSGSQNQKDSVIQYHCNEPFYSFPWGENGKTISGIGVFMSRLNDER